MKIMSKVLRLLRPLLAGLLFVASPANAGSGSEGKEFYLAFQPNYGGTDYLYLFISGQQDTQGTVDIAGLQFHADFQVKANQITTINIPKAAGLLPTEKISKLTVHVQAAQDISVYGLNRRGGTTDGFLALPVDALGLEYFFVSFTPIDPAQLTLIGAFDGTEVTVTPTYTIGAHPAGKPFVVKLNAGETYMMNASGDLTGTNVVSNVPVVVMAGDESAWVPASTPFLDHIVEMMPPVSTWGKSFLTVPLATRKNGDMFRVVAAQDNTRVFVNGVLKATLRRGGYYQEIITVRSQITTSGPALVTQFAMGTSWDGVDADPFAMTIPPTEQFLDHYTLSTPNDNGFPRQFTNVVIPTSAIGALLLDGASVDPVKFAPIGTSGFSGGQLPVGPGSHTLRTTNGIPFGVYVYGFGYHDSYGYPGGMSFAPINPTGDPYPPALRLVSLGDTVQATATDSEDRNANGVLDPGEDTNGNGVIDRRDEDLNRNGKLDAGEDMNGNGTLDRDTGIFKVRLLDDAVNLKLDVLPFVPGVTSLQFNVTRIDNTKPGTGTVHVEDGAGNKTSGLVEIGVPARMQNVRVVATLSGTGIDIDQGSFRTAPFSTTSGTDQQVVEWRFDKFSTDMTADLGFDIVLKNPRAGEHRTVTRQVDLYYTDAGGQARHSALDPTFVDVLASSVALTASTDKASYGGGDALLATSAVQNLAVTASDVGVRLTILDANNVKVADFGGVQRQTIDAGATKPYAPASYPLAGLAAGNYVLVAEALDASGSRMAIASASFSIVTTAPALVKASVASDKQLYNPGETANISDRIASATPELALDNLQLVTTVANPDGSLRSSKTENIAQLAGGATRDFQYKVALAGAPAGRYVVTLEVNKPDGSALARASAAFAVASSADTGAGLTGTVSAMPTTVPLGDSVVFGYSVNNGGNSALTALPLKLSLVNPAAKTVLAEYPSTQALAVGQTYSNNVNWLSDGQVGDNYVALLSAAVGGKDLALAQATFAIGPPPVKLDLHQGASSLSRVLVLVACGDGENDAVPAGGQSPTCLAQRTATIDQALAGLNVSHLVTSDPQAFRSALRSGRHNTLWLSGKPDKLDDRLVTEVIEAVNSGSGLLLDGVHDQRNKRLDAVAGIDYRGKLGELDLAVSINGTDFAAAQLPASGRALKLQVSGGVAQAAFAGGSAALVTQQYGRGHSVMFAFDLVTSLGAASGWKEVAGQALKYALAPQELAVLPGAPLGVATGIANLAHAVDLRVTSTLPASALVIDAAPLPLDNSAPGQVAWALALPEGGDANTLLTIAAPQEAGSYVLRTVIESVRNGKVMPYGDPLSFTFTVKSAAQGAADAQHALDLLVLAKTADQKARDKAAALIQSALADLGANSVAGCESAIGKLADAVQAVAGLPADTAAVRGAIDDMLREAEWRWWRAVTAP